jgi:hypothetical protein
VQAPSVLGRAFWLATAVVAPDTLVRSCSTRLAIRLDFDSEALDRALAPSNWRSFRGEQLWVPRKSRSVCRSHLWRRLWIALVLSGLAFVPLNTHLLHKARPRIRTTIRREALVVKVSDGPAFVPRSRLMLPRSQGDVARDRASAFAAKASGHASALPSGLAPLGSRAVPARHCYPTLLRRELVARWTFGATGGRRTQCSLLPRSTTNRRRLLRRKVR